MTEVPGAEDDPREETRTLLRRLTELDEDDPERVVVRERLIGMLMPLAYHLAGRFRDRGEPMDDLTQVAAIGLIQAVDRFDPTTGYEFSTFATPTILGEIKRYFRDRAWAIKVPRRLQEMRQQLTVATDTLTQDLGRSPTVQELAQHLNLGEEDVLEGMQSAQAYSTVSLDPLVGSEDDLWSVAARLGELDAGLELVENRAALTRALADLPARDRTILHLRFVEDLTQVEIASVVGISQMHVSRLLTRVLARLRLELAASD